MKKKKNKAALVIILTVLIAVSLFVVWRLYKSGKIFGNVQAQSSEVTDLQKDIQLTYTVQRRDVGDYFEVSGNVEAEEYTIQTQVSGRVTYLLVGEGDRNR